MFSVVFSRGYLTYFLWIYLLQRPEDDTNLSYLVSANTQNMAKVYQFLILIFPVICKANTNCKFKFKNNTATELEFGFKPPTNFKSINIKFPETPNRKLFECASEVDDSVTIKAKYQIGTNLIISEFSVWPKPLFWFMSDTKTQTKIGRYFRPDTLTRQNHISKRDIYLPLFGIFLSS